MLFLFFVNSALFIESVFLPLKGDEFRFGNMLFTSKFDSGNLQHVEKVAKDQQTLIDSK